VALRLKGGENVTRQQAEAHWEFIEGILKRENEDGMVDMETVHYLYVEAMVHGAKHETDLKDH